MVELEIVGELPGDWHAQIVAFAEAATEHPWGGQVSDRLVVADNVPGALERWMKPQEWAEKEAQYKAMVGATGGKAFVARDEKHTAVVPAIPDKAVFLTLTGHELLESAGERRAAAEGYLWPGTTNAGFTHLVRTEYTVERTRRDIADALRWPRSVLEVGSLAATARDIASELPKLLRWAVANDDVPHRLYQHWGELILSWGGACGRADAGDREARADIDAFYSQEIIAPSAALWREVAQALAAAYAHPDQRIAKLDEDVVDAVTKLHWEGLGAFWNPLYEDALRGTSRTELT